MSKLSAFVSHSFDEKDAKVCGAFLKLLKRHFRVITSERNEPGLFSEKIKSDIRSADIFVGIFTRRFKVSNMDSGDISYVPPAYTISECAYALGAYRESSRALHGFVEDGIQYDSIGLPTAAGEEFPRFSRGDVLKGNTARIEEYIRKIKKQIQQTRAGSAFIQEHLRKTVEIYRDGSAIFKNTVRVLICNSDRVKNVGGLDHRIWIPNPELQFPSLEIMKTVPVSPRFDTAFLSATVLRLNGQEKETSIGIDLVRSHGSQMEFLLRFPFDLKTNDRIEYQYVWSMPRAYITTQQRLRDLSLEYQEVSIRANHGVIKAFDLRLKFERGNSHGVIAELFSKSPYIVTTPSSDDDAISYDPPLTPSCETDSIFLTYEHSGHTVLGSVRMRWIPN